MQVKVDGKRNITLDFEAPKKFKLLQDGKEIPYLRTGKNSFRLSRNIDGVLDLEEIIEQPKIVKPMQLQAQQMALVNPNDVLMINQAAQQLEVEQNILGETQKRVEQTQAYLDVQQQRINETVLGIQGLETNNAERITATENGLFNLAGNLATTEQNLIDGIEIVNNGLQEHKSVENPHRITKKTIGLDKVDNTSDMDKPISKAVQSALDEKADKDEIQAIRDELGEYQEKNDRFTNALSNYTGGLAGNQLPDGGLTGQVLGKRSDISGDVEWINSSASITVDDELSLTSKNPVQNKVITSSIIIKSDTIPTASEILEGAIYQYSGETGTYTHGYIYECQEKTNYTPRISFESSKIGYNYDYDLLAFFQEATPNFAQIKEGIFQYFIAGDIWSISAKDENGNIIFDNYKLYTEDLQNAGFVFLEPSYTDEEEVSYELALNPVTYYEWTRIDVQPNQSAEVASLTTRVGNLETGKQDKLTAIQLDAVNSGANTTNIGQITTNKNDIADINALIPNQATTSNQLADKGFVNSSIATNTAYFIGTFNSVAELEAYSGTLTNNDYAFVTTTDTAGNTLYDRYKWNGSQWLFEYELNNSSFTASQWASINSNATAEKIAKISTNETAINNHIANTSNPHSVTKAQVGLGNVDDTSDLSKPISTATQTALNGKQATLVSGTNIKTINNSSVLGSGNLSVGTVKSVNNTSPDENGNVTLSIPAAQIQSDWTQADNTKLDYIKNKPTIPTVNNSTITLTQGGVTKGSFTLNQASGATIDFDAGGGGGSYTAGTGIDITAGTISVTSPTLVNKNASGLSILGNTTSGSSTAIGKNATASGDNSIAISGSNYTTTSTGLTSVAIGAQADATNTLALALGGYAKASGYCSIQIGYGTNTEASSLYVGTSFSDNWKMLGNDGKIPAERYDKATIVGWCMPDYSAGVSKSWNTSIQADKDGWVYVKGSGNSTVAAYKLEVSTNGSTWVRITSFWASTSTTGAAMVPMPKGTYYKATESPTTSARELIFYPCKGA